MVHTSTPSIMWSDRIKITPAVPVLLAVLLLLFPSMLLLAIFFAALLHELGHYTALRLMEGHVKQLTITPLGVEMTVVGQLSYPKELALAAAGPAVNLLLAVLLSRLGARWESCYLFGGVHLVLGIFNLLPIMPLDGGMLLWNAVAWCIEPYTADRISAVVGLFASILLSGAAIWMLLRGGSPFLLIATLGLLRVPLQQIGLVKPRQTR